MNIGTKLTSLRKLHHFSQDDLSQKIHVSRQTISNWETDKTYPDIQSLVLLADVFDLSLDQLVKEDIPIMKNDLFKNKLRWLFFGVVITLVLDYLSLIVLKSSLTLDSLLVGSITVLGLVLIILLIKTTKSAQLRTFTDIIRYLNNQDSPETSQKKHPKNLWLQYLIGAIIGLGLGSVIVWAIFKFILHINLI